MMKPHNILITVLLTITLAACSTPAVTTTSSNPVAAVTMTSSLVEISMPVIVTFTDPVLEAMIRGSMGKTEGDITLPDGRLTVTIKGVDIYDPTTGEIRSSSTDDIACWFVDTEYNGESFFVRHAYFTGADQPYDKLKRALRAEVDESAWSALYSSTSYPFEKPETGKIAVKVINHYGDEVLKVYDCH